MKWNLLHTYLSFLKGVTILRNKYHVTGRVKSVRSEKPQKNNWIQDTGNIAE